MEHPEPYLIQKARDSDVSPAKHENRIAIARRRWLHSMIDRWYNEGTLSADKLNINFDLAGVGGFIANATAFAPHLE